MSFLKRPQNTHSKVLKECSACRDRNTKPGANKRPSVELDINRLVVCGCLAGEDFGGVNV
jgi:hypothetical protein